MATFPLSGFMRSERISSRVDLPDPLGPIRAIRSPSDTVNGIFWKSGATPYLFESPCALIIGVNLLGPHSARVLATRPLYQYVRSPSLLASLSFVVPAAQYQRG